jgi:hypothetical protein
MTSIGRNQHLFSMTYVGRLTKSMLFVGSMVYLGVIVGKAIGAAVLTCTLDSVAGIKIEWGLTAVAATYLLTSFEKLLKLLRTLIDHVKQPSKSVGISSDSIALVGTVVYLTVVIVAFNRTRQCEDHSETQGKSPSKEVVYLSRATEPRVGPVEWVPFFFPELASTEEKPSKGTQLSAQQLKDLEILLGSLRACVGEQPGEDVVLDVRGYADRNEFRNDSVNENRKVANRRASTLHDAVVGLLGVQSGQSSVRLNPLRLWSEEDPGAMEREGRYFSARSFHETGTTRDQGLINRRADLLILGLGVCMPMQNVRTAMAEAPRKVALAH